MSGDRDPRMIHEFEQMTATLLDFARLLARYREELEREGFTREESLELCRSYQADMLGRRTGS